MLFIPMSEKRFFVYCSLTQRKFRASGKDYLNQGEAISYRVTFLLLLETIFYAFFYIYSCLSVKAVFRHKGNVFFNEYFILAGGIKIFVKWKQYSFIYGFSFFLRKPLLAIMSVSTSRNEGFS